MDAMNTAIWKVISNQYKKDCKDAHETVTSYGYEIFKWEGCYYVKNPKTDKQIHAKFVDYGYSCGHIFSIYGNWLDNPIRVDNKHPLRFDFVGYLEKPVNPIRKENMVWRRFSSN